MNEFDLYNELLMKTNVDFVMVYNEEFDIVLYGLKVNQFVIRQESQGGIKTEHLSNVMLL